MAWDLTKWCEYYKHQLANYGDGSQEMIKILRLKRTKTIYGPEEMVKTIA